MIYPYQCSGCGKTHDVWQRLADYVASPNIPVCCGGVQMHRVFTVPMMQTDYAPFVSPIDGTVINSRSGHREHMKQHGVVLYDDIASELPARRAAAEADRVAGIKDDVNAAITKVAQGYKPERKMAVETETGIDVLNVHDLPKELRSEVAIEV